ncbi:MAG TPA: acetyl-CoA carboxylase biotin carboxylase subunit [Vicinamibacterales bacterium]|nr:acetyl-CoA carboxylase biotin carboxylase subunit [Vicinamibacterales bacterium]
MADLAITRLLVANRGEIALRIIRACRELGIESVAVYSDADVDAPHVAAADHSVRIGPAPAVESYLSIPRIIKAARSTSAAAIHPGYGFLSENAQFAAACVEAGVIFVGPPADAIARMGSKIEARRIAAAAGVPVVPGETPADQSDAGIRVAVERIGLPALIKASAGGGGKGMRTVRDAGAIDESIQAARREAQAAFGDGTLYVERLVDRPRHVEVQVFADARGHVLHVFERDCSTQRRHQKVIEESPSPAVGDELRSRMTQSAVAAARAVGYVNAGTIEFLVDDGGVFYFLEMNTRLQVEHPVTEEVVGVDLVRAQLLVASGAALPWTQHELTQRGHAIEARVYAEDPSQGFLPQAGRLTEYREPRWPGVRVDSGAAEGSEVSIYYDPMIAKVIARAETRDLATARLTAALRDFHIGGIRTNVPFLIAVLESEAFRRGAIDTAFLDREGAALAPSIDVHSARAAPQRSAAAARTQAAQPARAAIGHAPYDPWNGGDASRPASTPTRAARRRSAGAAAGTLTSPMPATVLKVNVRSGDRVKKGDTVVLLEAMKMELPVRSPADATVGAVLCREGELVAADATLVELR